MVQVRCPDCGYLQSLSDERFLNISEDFLNCPHCHAKIPKTWKPVEVESIPEEVRHKILAFSSRILNGGGITREVVCALESLVRKYGALENSFRALGLGYASVGEAKKAEEFLTQVHNQDPNPAGAQSVRSIDALLHRRRRSCALFRPAKLPAIGRPGAVDRRHRRHCRRRPRPGPVHAGFAKRGDRRGTCGLVARPFAPGRFDRDDAADDNANADGMDLADDQIELLVAEIPDGLWGWIGLTWPRQIA